MRFESALWRTGLIAVIVAVVAGVGAVLVDPRDDAAAQQGLHGALIATADAHHVRVYRHKRANHVWKRLDNPNSQGAPLVFLVKKQTPRWLKVLLPVRPNHSVGWVRAKKVKLSRTTYRVDVRLHRHRAVVHHGTEKIMSAPVAVGKHATPTPTGRFYITSLLQPSNPHGAYGPYAFGLSAYSDVIFHFGGGPGQIGLHGTDQPKLLGESVSHGCIRLSNKHITKLAQRLPLGTPVTVHG
ncbi:MAG: L,D-transpeptidase [Streptosporangiales bacterium]